MKKFNFLFLGIVFHLFTQSNLIAQDILPNFKMMLSQGYHMIVSKAKPMR